MGKTNMKPLLSMVVFVMATSAATPASAALSGKWNCNGKDDKAACLFLKEKCKNVGNSTQTYVCQRDHNKNNISITCKNGKPTVGKKHKCYKYFHPKKANLDSGAMDFGFFDIDLSGGKAPISDEPLDIDFDSLDTY